MLTALTRLTQLIPRTAATPLLRHHFSTTAAAMANKWIPSSTPYPTVRRDESFIEQFKSAANGQVAVADPYNWLSQPAGTNDEVARFVSEQGDYTREYLKANTDAPLFKEALTKNWDYARFSAPSLKGDNFYYFSYNSGLSPQPSIYRFPKGEEKLPVKDGEIGGSLFFDPNVLSTDGSVSRSSSAFSEDGKKYAYALSRSGSDWTTIYVRKTSSPHVAGTPAGKDHGQLDDEIRFVKFSGIGWTKDSKGFFYQRLPEREEHGTASDDVAGTETQSDLNAKIYYHIVGTPQSADTLVYEDLKNPEWMFGVGATECGRYVTMSTSKDTARENLFWVADLQAGEIGMEMKWTKVVNEWGAYYGELGNDGSKFYFYTSANDSPNYKVVTYDLEHPELGFVDLIAHDPKALLSSVHLCNDNSLVLLYSIDVKDVLYLHDLKTGARVSRLAEGLVGSIDQISGRRQDKEFWFSMTSFTSPGTVYHYDFTNGVGQEQRIYRVAKVDGIDPRDFVSEQVFYESKDGTRVPMFITRPADLKNDGTAPAILYGYGGFSASMDPFFSPSLLTWIKHYKGVLAVANIRGGGEYGEAWHLGGVKEKKQNVFDDFISAAKYLHSTKIAAKDKVAISGGSNGGLLVAACLNQAPELFGAVIADVGVLDMLRFQRYTIGRAWCSDYGNADEPNDFDYLIKYSPLHNVDAAKTYPPTMLLTADHDDRVVPLHSFKHAAELQHTLAHNPHPLLLRVDTKSGHGAGKSTEKKIEEAVDKYGFVAHSMGLKWVA